jgi:hypothetical protein
VYFIVTGNLEDENRDKREDGRTTVLPTAQQFVGTQFVLL